MAQEKILEVKDLVINFKTDAGLVQAVRGVSFDLSRGETLCIVGESGSGKSVTSKAIMGILAGNAIVENGSIMYEGENLLEVSEDEFYKIRGNKIGMIFQDPLSSLNPIVRIGKQITEAMLINSNKLKLMYDNIISKELIAYKNTIAKAQISSEREKKYTAKQIDALKIKLTSEGISEEEKLAIKNEIAKLNNELKEKLAVIKEECNAKLPELKAKLNAKKVVAKKEVADYKHKVELEYKEKVARIKEKYQSEKSTLSDEQAKKALTKKYKAELVAAKQELIDKTRITKAAAKKKALEIMAEVGIPLPEKRFRQYPFEFSGGMRQRIVIAIALTAAPEILICDEPTTALDVTIQAQILELIKKIQAERNIACIFITHDLGVVANMADRVAVMYAGKIVEYGKSEEIFFEPKHPYTWALLSSIPDVDSKERLDAIPGTPPNMIYPPKGDAFAARSKYAMQIDFEVEPPYFKVSDTHYAATWLLHPNAPQVEMPKIVSERIKNALKGKGGNDSE
jgi:oligopeptide transport system ATP-binding protein